MVTPREAGREEETGIYACEPERPLYVVDAIIYDTYRSQLRVMALTLVFMAILFLVAFHGRRRRFTPLSSLLTSPRRSSLFLGDFGPYAKQAVILVWFTSVGYPLPTRNSAAATEATSNPTGKVITLDRAISPLWFLTVWPCHTRNRVYDHLLAITVFTIAIYLFHQRAF